MAEFLESFARCAGERVQQIVLALLIDAVVEEGAEPGAAQRGRRIGHGLQQLLAVELRSDRLPGLVEDFEQT